MGLKDSIKGLASKIDELLELIPDYSTVRPKPKVIVLGRGVIELCPLDESISAARIAAVAALSQGLATSMILENSRPKPQHWDWFNIDETLYYNPNIEANPHINISGSSGFGKSTFARHLVKQINGIGIPVLIADVHDEYRDLEEDGFALVDPVENSLSVWSLDGESPRQKTAENVSILKSVLELGDIQAWFLSKAAKAAYEKNGIKQDDKNSWTNTPPTMRQVIRQANNAIYASKYKDKSLVTLVRRLELLDLTDAFSGKTPVPLEKLVKQSTVINLASLKTREAATLYTEILLRKIYGQMLKNSKNEGIKLYVLIDEAQRAIPQSSSREGNPEAYASVISQEARKYGIGLITSTQQPTKLGPEIIGNAALTVAFHQKEPDEAKYIARLLAGDSADSWKQSLVHRELNELKQFQCMVVSTHHKNPIILDIEKPVRGGKPKESEEKEKNEVLGFRQKLEKIVGEKGGQVGVKVSRKQPDFSLKLGGKSIAVLIEEVNSNTFKLKQRIQVKKKDFDWIVVVMGEKSVNQKVRKLYENDGRVKVLSEGETLDWIRLI